MLLQLFSSLAWKVDHVPSDPSVSPGSPVKAVSKRYFDLTDREPSVQPVCIRSDLCECLRYPIDPLGIKRPPKLHNFTGNMMSKLVGKYGKAHVLDRCNRPI